MRITGCHIKAFGRFRDERFEQLDESAVIILGGNETGKTTLRHFMATMLYGIHGGSSHPYAPRNGRALEGHMTIRRREGSRLEIGRRLDTKPRAYMVNGKEEAWDNRGVPSVQHVPRSVFEAVYSLDVGDLKEEVSGAALDEIRNRLFRARADDSLQAIAKVTEQLRQDANDLWRPEAPPSSAAGKLERRLDELAEEREEAQAQARSARSRYREIRQLERDIEDGWCEQEALREQLEHIDRLLPVRELLDRIKTLRERADRIDHDENLPENPKQALHRHAQQIEEYEHSLKEYRQRMKALRKDADLTLEGNERLLQQEENIESWKAKVAGHERQKGRLKEARQEKREARRALEEQADRLFSEPWHSDLAPAVREISLGELRRRIRDYEEEAAELKATKERAGALSEHAQVRRSVVAWLVFAALGAALWGAHYAAVVTYPWALPLGTALVAVGLLQALANGLHNRKLKQPTGPVGLEAHKSRTEEKAALVVEVISDIPIPEDRLDHIDRDLLDDVEALIAAQRTYDERDHRVQEEAASVLRDNEAVEALAQSCGVSVETHEFVHTVKRMASQLDVAKKRRRKRRNAKEQLPSLRRETRQCRRRLTRLTRERREWIRTLKERGNGDVQSGLRRLREGRAAVQRQRQIEERLNREYPDWEERRDELDALERKGKALDDTQKATLETRVDALGDRINQLRRQRDEKRKQLKELETFREPAHIASERQEVQAQLAERKRRRDQMMLLRNLLEEGRRRFRDHHEPEVLKTAGDVLRRITGETYQRLHLDDERWSLRVSEARDLHPVTTPPLSRGTVDQIQFAYRLALIRHLEQGQEHLPLFLDEVFVHWDTVRRRKAFSVLGEMRETRQLFIFTRHPYFAREAADFLDGGIVRLSGH